MPGAQLLAMEASERTCPMCRKAMTGTTLADYNMNYALRDAVAPNTDEWLLSPGAIELPNEPFPPGTFLGRGGSGMVVRGAFPQASFASSAATPGPQLGNAVDRSEAGSDTSV